ncbi:MAG: PAS domain S-box protein [Caldilineae bacterium]|nr:MAG: PAS domain S-box protein [Caldilineae bacterium]
MAEEWVADAPEQISLLSPHIDPYRKLIALQYAGATIASTLELDFVLDTIVRDIVEALGVWACAVFEWRAETKSIVLMAGYSAGGREAGTFPLQVGLLEEIPLFRQVVVEEEARQCLVSCPLPGLLHPFLPDPPTGRERLLVAPMVFQTQVVGLFVIADLRIATPFPLEDVAFIQHLANLLAAAIENARLHRQAQAEIAERREAELKLRRSEARLKALLNAIPDLIFRMRADGTLIDYKASSLDELYLPPERFLGKTIAEVMPPEMASQTASCMARALATRVPQTFEYTLPMPGGVQHYEARLIASGRREVLAIVRNITARVQAEQQLLRNERLAALGRLAAALAHEMNNPLQAIQSHLDLLLDYPLEEAEKAHYLQIIRQELGRLNDITRHVLNFTRPVPASQERVDVMDILDEMLVLVEGRLQQTNVRLTTHFDAPLPVWATPDHLLQVFLNLAINALDVLEKMQDSNRRLDISAYREAERVMVSFTNNGPAIAADDLPHIFEPFFTTKPDGNGLGLWISHNLVEQHGGTLTVENLPYEQGVIFTVQLPAAE